MKNILYSTFQTNDRLEKDGIFIEYGENTLGKPIRFKIARAGGSNKQFARTLEKLSRPHRRAIAMGSIPDEKAEQLYRKAFCSAVLLGWENVQDENNNLIEFSEENALKLFSDLPELFRDLREQANNVSLYRESILEDDLGNSGKCSATPSTKGKQNT